MDAKKIGAYLHMHMDKFKRKGLQLHRNHSAPMSRRELLSSGFIASCYSMTFPSLGHLLTSSKLLAQEGQCDLKKNVAGPAFAQFHFGGGRRLWGDGLALGLHSHGNPGDFTKIGKGPQKKDFLGYGLSPENHPLVLPYKKIGGHEVSPISYIYQSALDTFGSEFETINKKLNILSLCAPSQDDSRSTSQGLLAIAAKLRGKADFKIISNGPGTGQSGLSNLPFFEILERADVLNSTDIAQLSSTGLEQIDVKARVNYLNLFQSQIRERITQAESQALLGCSIKGAIQKIEFYKDKLEPREIDPDIQNLFGNSQIGSMAYMLANDLSLTMGMHQGGYDYHNGTSNGYNKDRQVFRSTIWPIVHYFHKKDLPLILFLTSDGATYSTASEVVPIDYNGTASDFPIGINTGDRGTNGGSMFIFLNSSKASLKLSHHQVGYGEPNSHMSKNNPVAADPLMYGNIAVETLRRASIALSHGKAPSATFQDITNGKRFQKDQLSKFMPIV